MSYWRPRSGIQRAFHTLKIWHCRKAASCWRLGWSTWLTRRPRARASRCCTALRPPGRRRRCGCARCWRLRGCPPGGPRSRASCAPSWSAILVHAWPFSISKSIDSMVRSICWYDLVMMSMCYFVAGKCGMLPKRGPHGPYVVSRVLTLLTARAAVGQMALRVRRRRWRRRRRRASTALRWRRCYRMRAAA